MKPNLELLEELYAIIDGIPDKNFNLSTVIKSGGRRATCRTIACAIGWAALHPKFKALGLRFNAQLGVFTSKTHGAMSIDYETAAEDVFGIEKHRAAHIFGVRHISMYDDLTDSTILSDKQLFLFRVKQFLTDEQKRVEHHD